MLAGTGISLPVSDLELVVPEWCPAHRPEWCPAMLQMSAVALEHLKTECAGMVSGTSSCSEQRAAMMHGGIIKRLAHLAGGC